MPMDDRKRNLGRWTSIMMQNLKLKFHPPCRWDATLQVRHTLPLTAPHAHLACGALIRHVPTCIWESIANLRLTVIHSR